MPQNILIIGGASLGPKAACRFKRLEPESRVTMVDQEAFVSYEGSAIPYFISGDISDSDTLRETTYHTLRDEKFYRGVYDINLLTNTRAISLDRRRKEVLIQNLTNGQQNLLSYDKLVIATGKRPKPLSIPGINLDGVFSVYNLRSAITVRNRIQHGQVEKAVIIGGGFTGLEMAEALSAMWGIKTTVVEINDQLLPDYISPNMAQMVRHHMEGNGSIFCLGEEVVRLEGQESVKRVVTQKRTIDTDLVIVAGGVEPNTELAKAAGLEISPTGAIVVDKKMQTSDPCIYAGGDCVEITNLITQKPRYFPLNSLAHRQGRIIGSNLAGGDEEFEGAVGNFVVKLFDISVASAGLSIQEARKEGLDAISVLVAQLDRAHFWPEKDVMFLELVAEKNTGRVLGVQGLGNLGDGMVGRINMVAAILKYRPSIADISNLEISYSPPFSAASDIINALGNTAENVLLGKNLNINADEFNAIWQSIDKNQWLIIDTSHRSEAEILVKKYPLYWKNIPVTELLDRRDEVSKEKKIVVLCKTGLRSYLSHLMLNEKGIENYQLNGGLVYLEKWGLNL